MRKVHELIAADHFAACFHQPHRVVGAVVESAECAAIGRQVMLARVLALVAEHVVMQEVDESFEVIFGGEANGDVVHSAHAVPLARAAVFFAAAFFAAVFFAAVFFAAVLGRLLAGRSLASSAMRFLVAAQLQMGHVDKS